MAAPYDFARDGNQVPYTTILQPAGGVTITTDAATTAALPAGTGFVMVSVTAPVHFTFAPDDVVTALVTDPMLLPGGYYFRVPVGMTHLAVTPSGDDGAVSVLKLV